MEKKKIYVTDNLKLMEEWNWEKNRDLNPYTITWKSDKKAWWICKECGHTWEAAIKNRSNGRGCPQCAKTKRVETFNAKRIENRGSLASEYPTLALQWHPTKNGELTPHDVTSKSGKKVWWQCEKGHEWQAAINNRSFHKRGCPYCAGQKALAGYNDLATINPALAKEWHPTKNVPLLPQNITSNSGLKVWWQCEKGHEWQATVDSRNKGSDCPYCSGRLVISGETDLETTHPEIAAEWHPNKNKSLLPSMVSIGTHKKVWWQCNKGHEWQAVIYSRRMSGCPICSSESKTSFPEQAIYYYFKQVTEAHNRFQIKSRTEIDIYLPQLKIGIEYDGAYYHSGQESAEKERRKQNTLIELGIVLLRVKELSASMNTELMDNVIYCKQNPSYADLDKVINALLLRIYKITGIKFNVDVNVVRDRSKIYSQYIEGEKENSLLKVNPQIAEQWHPYKNESLTPLMVTANSNKTVWWMCEKGHEWQANIRSRTSGSGCPYCAGQKALVGYNDLATINPSLAEEWHPTKNGDLFPKDVLPNSNKKVWWQCLECGHEWQAAINKRTSGRGCPVCAKKNRGLAYSRSMLEENGSLSIKHPNIAEEWHPTKNGDLLPIHVTSSTHKKVWWQCKKGHEWEMSVASRTRGSGCPICSGKRVVAGVNDLATNQPKLALEWHPTKNGTLSPNQVTSGCGKKVWWLCRVCGHEWEAVIGNRSKGVGCPKCRKKKK